MTLYIPSKQRIILCKETTAGTAVTTGGILGPVTSPQTQTQGTPAEEHADLGLGVDLFSITPVARSGTTGFTESLRSDALGMFELFAMLGGGSDAITGASDPYTHLGTVTSTLPPTYTLFHDTGQANEFLQMVYSTAMSVGISWSPTAAVALATQIAGLLPSVVNSAPTIATRTTAARARVYDGVYTYQSATAGTPYSGKVVSGSLMFNRNCAPVITSESASATDISPGALQMSGTMEIVYRGAAANTPYADWLLWKEQGTSANKNTITWTPSDGHSIAISWWPMVFTACDIVEGGDNALHVTVSFTVPNDLASANASSPVITAPAAVTVLNKIATAMS